MSSVLLASLVTPPLAPLRTASPAHAHTPTLTTSEWWQDHNKDHTHTHILYTYHCTVGLLVSAQSLESDHCVFGLLVTAAL